MVADRISGRRTPPILEENWPQKGGFQLAFWPTNAYTMGQTGAPVLLARTPPNHNRGDVSAMISTYSTTTPEVPARPTYPQDWRNYNLAQQNEKEHFLTLLKDLCGTVPQPPPTLA